MYGADNHLTPKRHVVKTQKRLDPGLLLAVLPALFIVGTRDALLPDQQHTRTLVEAKTDGHCQYVQIPGAGHVSLVMRRWPKMHQAIVEFCAEVSAEE